jgi:hypothetical protein
MYLSQDPIRLLGNTLNLYGFVNDLNIFLDIFGLSSKAGTGKLYEVGTYDDLKIKGAGTELDAHHVGQKAVMPKFVPNYNPDKAPAILVPNRGHTKRNGSLGTVSRKTNGITNARDLLARDIKELRRVYPDIPNEQLKKLIDMNKEIYPDAFRKPPKNCN